MYAAIQATMHTAVQATVQAAVVVENMLQGHNMLYGPNDI